jgi:hypothetical protein
MPSRLAKTTKSSIRQSCGLFRILARVLAAFVVPFDGTTGGTTQWTRLLVVGYFDFLRLRTWPYDASVPKLFFDEGFDLTQMVE